jgi:type II secretory ATPase GspE/PulE/Tfp pilus assembly ATPase PilB-like protein
MVGEICDLPTAEIAVKAAHGHMVMSTLHTNSAVVPSLAC